MAKVGVKTDSKGIGYNASHDAGYQDRPTLESALPQGAEPSDLEKELLQVQALNSNGQLYQTEMGQACDAVCAPLCYAACDLSPFEQGTLKYLAVFAVPAGTSKVSSAFLTA